MMSFRFDIIWQPLHAPQREGVAALEERLELVARPRVEEDRLGPALARTKHVAVAEAAQAAKPLKSASRTRPARMSLMCTS
jgi:hypothetical protein